MTRPPVAVALLAAFALASPSRAIEIKDAKTGKAQRVAVTVGADTGYFKYKEPDVMQETGTQLGIFARAQTYRKNKYLLEAFLSYVGGDLDYDGSVGNGVQYQSFSGTTPNHIINVRGLLGYRTRGGRPAKPGQLVWDFTPYTGLGYRYLYNDLMSDSTEYAGYERFQHYVYLPLGVLGETRLASQWTVQPRAEFDLLLRGWHRTEGRTTNHEFIQSSGFGMRGSVAFISKPARLAAMDFNLMVEPYGEYWKISESSTDEQHVEPDNNSYFLGLRGGVIF